MSHWVRRAANLIVVLLATAIVTIGGTDVALAHFGGGRAPSNWKGEITGISGPLPGVTFTLTDSADRVEVRSTSKTPLIIYGYQHKEPGDRDQYIKISADGVWINTESQAGYLNQTLLGAGTRVPERLRNDTGDGEPVWQKVSNEGVYRWHDHRVHWMSTEPPAVVVADPGSEHLIISKWTIYAKYGDQPEVAITGNLRWIPQQSAPWWVLVVGLAAAVVVVGSLRRWRAPMASVAGVLAVAAIGQAAVSPLPQDAYQGNFTFVLASAAIPALAVAGLCLLGVRALRRDALESARYLLGGAGALAAIQGTSDVAVLTRSQLEHTGPAWLARTVIAAVIGLGIGMVAAMVLRTLRRSHVDAEREKEQRRPLDIATDEEMREIDDSSPFLGRRRDPDQDDPELVT